MTFAFPDPTTWPYPEHYLLLPDGRLHYTGLGAGDPVLFVHGTPTWSYEWRHSIAAFGATREVVALDHLGFGLSERPAEANYYPEGHAARFAEAVEDLFPDGKFSLVLHDFGGPIALDWALDHPERIGSLVLVNTWMWPISDDPRMRRAAALAGSGLSRFLYRRANASLRLIMPSAYGDRSRLTRAIHGQYLAPFPDPDSRERVLFALAKSLLGSENFFAGLWERRERLAEVPVTILWGMKDSAFPPSTLDRWRVGVPHARIVPFEDAGHWPHEEVPAEFNLALGEAL
jgi:haloalkane dehalogenase